MSDLYINVKSGVTTGAIGYKRPIINQRVSYRVGDTGWAYQNGFYDFSSDPTNPEVLQELDYTDTTNFYFKLKHNNVFGNKFRFTNSIGVNADVNGRIAGITFTGAIDRYIIDHLIGYAYLSVVTGSGINWNTTIDNITNLRNTNHLGFNDWIPVNNSAFGLSYGFHFLNENIFQTTAFYLGDTNVNTTSQAWRLVNGGSAVTAKTTVTSSTYACMRKHY